MTDPTARTFSSDFKRFFARGLVVLLPTVLTLWIVVKAYQFVDQAIAEPINGGMRLAMNNLAPYWQPIRTAFDPSETEVVEAMAEAGNKAPTKEVMIVRLRTQNIQLWWAERWYMDLIGLVVAIVGVYVAGRLLGGFLGRSVYRRVERLITSLPVFKQVYPYVKQVVDFLFSSDDKQLKFSRVVMVEYPRKGAWSIGFLTGRAMKSVSANAPGGTESVTVFVPSSPTPFTGYAVNVPITDVVELPITVEEAVRFVVSCGVLIPATQQGGEPSRGGGGGMPPAGEVLAAARAAMGPVGGAMPGGGMNMEGAGSPALTQQTGRPGR